MIYTENNRISHRQLTRQLVLSLTAPFLLGLLSNRSVLGGNGMLASAAVLLPMYFYVIFLIRLSPYYGSLPKYMGKWGSLLIGIFYLSFVIFTGAYLLRLVEDVVPVSLLTKFPGKGASLIAVLVCSFGMHRGMQKRGRMGEVSCPAVLGGLVLLLIVAAFQGSWEYFCSNPEGLRITPEGFLQAGYGILSAFTAVGLLPFSMNYVEKARSGKRPVFLGIGITCLIFLGSLAVLQANYGWERLHSEKYPILPLLAGANLPGEVLARFDVIWLAVLLYSLLFAVGSVLHYGSQILQSLQLGNGKYWIALLMYLLTWDEVLGFSISDGYGTLLAYVYFPGFLAVGAVVWMKNRRKT